MKNQKKVYNLIIDKNQIMRGLKTMKKLIMSLATVILMAGSIMSAAVVNHQRTKTPAIGSSDPTTSNEDAEDIASKLWNKTIKIDPNVFLNKNLQTDKEEFDDIIEEQRILTPDEAQYVSWGSLNINIAGWYWNKGSYTVTKDGATATGHFTVDADTGETPQQIAQKIANAPNIKFNYNYWNNKSVQNNLVLFRQMLVTEQVLTKAEASVVAGIQQSAIITKTGEVTFGIIVNDNNTSFDANIHVNVVNDGKDAQQIADEIKGLGYGLKTNVAGMYADTNYVVKNLVDLLVANYGQNMTDLDYLVLPHIKLQADNPNFPAEIVKDGQNVTAPMDLECKTNPYIYYYKLDDYNMQLEYLQMYVNLDPYLVNQLKAWFPKHGHKDDLEYFYSMLDDNQCSYMPVYSGKYEIPWTNRLDQNIDAFGNHAIYSSDNIIQAEGATTKNAQIKEFEEQLASAVMNSNGYLSIMFEWSYIESFYQAYCGIANWKFW